METVRIVNCPECHQKCGWCAWYAKNAREMGCGSGSKRKCEWGRNLKGTTCSLCDGSGRVQMTARYERAPVEA